MTTTPGPGWQVTASVSPGPPKTADPPADDPLALTPQGWHDAADGVRTALKWMVTALAAVGAAMFAKGFVTTPRLSWADDGLQLGWALVLGAGAVLSIACLIALVVRQLRPALFDLSRLPKEFVALIDQQPRAFLPSDSATLAEYRTRFDRLLHQAASAKDEVARQQGLLDAAKAVTPADPARVAAVGTDLQVAKDGYQRVLRDLGVYTRVRTSLFDRAEYHRQSTLFDSHLGSLATAAVVAAVCGVGYQLALATPETSTSAATAPAAPVVGELVASATAAGRALWSDLRLAGCQASPAVARIPVVVGSGAGTVASPYVVTTLPTGTCTAQTFTVVDEVARVVKPAKQVITYTPATATPSTG